MANLQYSRLYKPWAEFCHHESFLTSAMWTSVGNYTAIKRWAGSFKNQMNPFRFQ